MRTYSKNYASNPRKQPYVTAKERAERLSREWDVRIDVNLFISPADIKASLEADKEGLVYALIGGVEVPDKQVHGATFTPALGSSQDHVHIALVFHEPVNRERALRACRPEKVTDEYAVPRNQRFTYAGWLAHHAKAQYKLDPLLPTIYWEHGVLPEDAMDEKTCWDVAKILKKFGTKQVKARFSHVYAALDEFKAAKRNEAIQAVANADTDEAFVLPPIPAIPKHMIVTKGDAKNL